MDTTFDIAVIGNGMIGAAASRYLSASALRVAAIGPSEPDNWQTHNGVFASHYDQGRITRITDPDLVWGLLGKRSIASYAEIEEKSGIRFHYPVGQLRVSPDSSAAVDSLNKADAVGRQLAAPYVRLDRNQLRQRFPYLHFAEKAEALWEEGNAGFINPRLLVQAQLAIAEKQGATLIRQEAVRVQRKNGESIITTQDGKTIRAAKVLLANGAYANHILERKLDLRPKAVSVVLAEVGEAEQKRLQDLPTLIWRLENHPVLASIYSVPPTAYPDGRVYFKIGGTLRTPVYMHKPEEFLAHFHSPGNAHEIAALSEVLLDLLPGLKVDSWQSRPCVVTYTAHEYPYIDQADEGTFVAIGGCGSAAKSSDELGRIAAILAEKGDWQYDVGAQTFHANWL